MYHSNRFSAVKQHLRARRNQKELTIRSVRAKPHDLDAPLVVSLTSFPKRYGTLPLTLKSLLKQTVKADKVVLWIAEEDMATLPDEVLELRGAGLEIRSCENLRSFKKLVPALQENPNRYLVTADDDVYYEKDWLEKLVTGAHKHPKYVISHRTHQITYDVNGRIKPYGQWKHNISRKGASRENFATGVSGVLYPPNSFHPMTTDKSVFMRICATTDDIWFHWMARLTGTEVYHLGPKRRIVEWPSSQEISLRSHNHGQDHLNGNDTAIEAMIEHFGQPTLEENRK